MRNSTFAKAFNPQSIAIVGVSRNPKPADLLIFGSSLPDGIGTLSNLLNIGYKGRIYPINPRADTILGQRAYPSVSSLPEKVDLVILTVPNKDVPGVLEDCVKAGVSNVHIMTSGFGETGQEGYEDIERRVHEIIVKGGLRVIGPNCVGIQVPSVRMTTLPIRGQKPGTTAFISQSGGHALAMMVRLTRANIGVSKMISFGNAMILDSTDFIEYLGDDPDTEIITAYLEGVKDGRRLLEVVGRVNATKPVVIWKGGLTSSGARAAFSHTGSLGGSRQIWEAFFKQTKAIQVNGLDDIVDMITAFKYLRSINGKAAAVLSMGGGSSVAAGDICAEAGILVPPLSQTSTEQLLQHVSLVNRGIANPFDVYDPLIRPQILEKMLNIMFEDPAIDFVILNYPSDMLVDNDSNNRIVSNICDIIRNNKCSKPVVFAINIFIPTEVELTPLSSPIAEKLVQNGIPVYPSLERACRAVVRLLKYKASLSSVK